MSLYPIASLVQLIDVLLRAVADVVLLARLAACDGEIFAFVILLLLFGGQVLLQQNHALVAGLIGVEVGAKHFPFALHHSISKFAMINMSLP